MSNQPLSALRAELVQTLSDASRATDETRTPLLRTAAGLLVSAREFFKNDKGEADWNGRTYAYRQWARDVYSDAGIVGEELPATQAAVRYHVSNVLRERLDEDELANRGLLKQGGRERRNERRRQQDAVLSALTSRDLQGGAMLAVSAAWTVLSKVDGKDLDDLSPEARKTADAALADAERIIGQLRDRLHATV